MKNVLETIPHLISIVVTLSFIILQIFSFNFISRKIILYLRVEQIKKETYVRVSFLTKQERIKANRKKKKKETNIIQQLI